MFITSGYTKGLGVPHFPLHKFGGLIDIICTLEEAYYNISNLHLATFVRKLYYPYLGNITLLKALTIATKDFHGKCIVLNTFD